MTRTNWDNALSFLASDAPAMDRAAVANDLEAYLNRLEAQLAELREAAGPFDALLRHIEKERLAVLVQQNQRTTPVRFAVEALGDRVLSMLDELRALARAVKGEK